MWHLTAEGQSWYCFLCRILWLASKDEQIVAYQNLFALVSPEMWQCYSNKPVLEYDTFEPTTFCPIIYGTIGTILRPSPKNLCPINDVWRQNFSWSSNSHHYKCARFARVQNSINIVRFPLTNYFCSTRVVWKTCFIIVDDVKRSDIFGIFCQIIKIITDNFEALVRSTTFYVLPYPFSQNLVYI